MATKRNPPATDEIPRYLRHNCIVMVLEKKLYRGAKSSCVDNFFFSRGGGGEVFFFFLTNCIFKPITPMV